MIFYVTGPLGAGKSFYVVRKMAKALLEGKAVAGNIRLVDNWAEILAARNPYCRFNSIRRNEYAKELRTRFFYDEDIEFLTHIKLKGKGEGRGLLVLDEAHNELNNMDYMKKEAREMLRWITLSRKKGWFVYIVSQHADNTVSGLRRIATVKVSLVNWKQITKFPFLDMALLPIPLFVATARPNDEAYKGTGAMKRKRPLFRDVFLLSWPRHLYNTFELFGEEIDDPFQFLVPSSPDERERIKQEWLESKISADLYALPTNENAAPSDGASVQVVRPLRRSSRPRQRSF